jgi:uncharacterized protein YlzI (FlbEa/FlbD family)
MDPVWRVPLARKFLIILAWAILTSPNGNPVYVNTSGIQAIHQAHENISLGKTMLILSGGNQIYVLESPQEVVKKIKNAEYNENINSR